MKLGMQQKRHQKRVGLVDTNDAGTFVQIAMLSHPLMDMDVYVALTECKFKAVREALCLENWSASS